MMVFSKKNRNQKVKKETNRDEQKAKPAVPARKFHELPEVLYRWNDCC